MLGNTIRYIEDRNDIHGLKKSVGQPYETEVNTAKFLLGHILTLKIPEEGILMYQINAIKEVIGPIENAGPVVHDTINPHTLDFSQLKLGSSIYVNPRDNKFHIEIHTASHPSIPILAVKTYTARRNPTDLDAINSEIRILNTLSAKSNPHNCFLRYYGDYKLGDSVNLVMEHADSDLMTKITE